MGETWVTRDPELLMQVGVPVDRDTNGKAGLAGNQFYASHGNSVIGNLRLQQYSGFVSPGLKCKTINVDSRRCGEKILQKAISTRFSGFLSERPCFSRLKSVLHRKFPWWLSSLMWRFGIRGGLPVWNVMCTEAWCAVHWGEIPADRPVGQQALGRRAYWGLAESVELGRYHVDGFDHHFCVSPSFRLYVATKVTWSFAWPPKGAGVMQFFVWCPQCHDVKKMLVFVFSYSLYVRVVTPCRVIFDRWHVDGLDHHFCVSQSFRLNVATKSNMTFHVVAIGCGVM